VITTTEIYKWSFVT